MSENKGAKVPPVKSELIDNVQRSVPPPVKKNRIRIFSSLFYSARAKYVEFHYRWSRRNGSYEHSNKCDIRRFRYNLLI